VTEIIYHPKADDEVFGSARLYERRGEGLGWRFLRAVQRSEDRIRNGPLIFPVLRDEIRKCPVRRFPFNVLFRVELDCVFVVAVAHHKRRPGYWLRRLRTTIKPKASKPGVAEQKPSSRRRTKTRRG
jgi:hypothetical protein